MPAPHICTKVIVQKRLSSTRQPFLFGRAVQLIEPANASVGGLECGDGGKASGACCCANCIGERVQKGDNILLFLLRKIEFIGW